MLGRAAISAWPWRQKGLMGEGIKGLRRECNFDELWLQGLHGGRGDSVCKVDPFC